MRTRPFRPGFDHTVEASPAEVGRAVARLLEGDAPFVGTALDGHLMLSVPSAARHFWSPWLHLDVRPHRSEERSQRPARTYVRGFFTPHPSLWSAFVFTYLALATVLAFAVLWAFVEWSLDRTPVAAWVALAVVVVAFALFLVSRAGRALAADQMDAIQAAVGTALASVGAVSRGAGDDDPH